MNDNWNGMIGKENEWTETETERLEQKPNEWNRNLMNINRNWMIGTETEGTETETEWTEPSPSER